MTTQASFDWKLAVTLSNNNPSIAKELLKMFVQELASSKADLIEAYDQKNFKQLAKLSHKLHGACCYCGVPRLKDLTKEVEHEEAPSFQKLIDEIDLVQTLLKKEQFT